MEGRRKTAKEAAVTRFHLTMDAQPLITFGKKRPVVGFGQGARRVC